MGYHGWDAMGWMMPFGGLLWLLFLVAVVAAIVWLVRGSRQSGETAGRGGHSAGLDILEARYAKGEIDRNEYLQKKQDLGG